MTTLATADIRDAPADIRAISAAWRPVDAGARTARTSPMTVKVLGPLDTGAEPLGPRERTVLAALIARRGSNVAPDELADAWWGPNPPTTWAQQVRNSVARIRTRLGREAVETDGADYRCGLEPESIDAVVFERLIADARSHALRGHDDRAADAYRRALALWRGAPFPEAAAWEPAVAESRRLAAVRGAAEEEALEARLNTGDHRGVIPEAERLVREEPLREDRWAILALAYYRGGRQADALAALRAARHRLENELGISPGPRLASLETAILRQDASLEPPDARPEASADCPYPGLRSFGADDADLYFGRDADIERVLAHIAPGSASVVAGPSGSGKSSLVLGGVLPRVRATGRDVAVTTPGAAAAAELAAASVRARLVVVDQAEELFALPADEVASFAAAARGALDGGCTVLFTVRSDSLDRLRALPELGDRLSAGVYLLGPLSVDGVRAAIEGPAARSGLLLEPGLVELALRDCGDRMSTLPALSHALQQTWARREGSTLTVAGYEASGGIAGAIAQSAEDVYARFDSQEQEACRAILLRLVDRDDAGAPSRRRLSPALFADEPGRRRVLARLIDARLVTADDADIQLSHEAVATAWPRLDRWLDEHVTGRHIARLVESSAQEWDAGGRSDDDLLRGGRLHAALDWRETAASQLTETEDLYLAQSATQERATVIELERRTARERARNRVLRAALGGAAALLVAALVAAGVAVVRGRQAEASASDAQREALVASALSLRSSDRDLAALLAVEAYRRWPGDDRVRSALLGVMMSADGLVHSVEYPDAAIDLAPVGDGAQALAVVDDGSGPRVGFIDLDSLALRRTFDVDVPADPPFERAVAISPDRRIGVIQSPQLTTDGGKCCTNDFAIIDLTSGRPLPASQLVKARTTARIAFSDDSSMLYVGNSVTFDLEAIDLRTGELRASSVSALQDHSGVAGITDTVANVGDDVIAVGSPDAVRLYDGHSLTPRGSISTDGNLSTSGMVVDGEGGLLVAGTDGLARIDVARKAVLWQMPSVAGRPCYNVALVPSRGLGYCSALGTIAEFDLATGRSTGRQLATLVDESAVVTPAPDGSELIANAPLTHSLQRWRLDGSGPTTRVVAAGRQLAGGLSGDGSLAVTSRDGTSSVWNLDTDTDAGVTAPHLGWISPTALERWTDTGTLGLVDVTGVPATMPSSVMTDSDGTAWPIAARPGHGTFAVDEPRGRVIAIDPRSSEPSGPYLQVPGLEFGMSFIGLSESDDGDRVALTYFDQGPRVSRTVVFDARTGAVVATGLTNSEGNAITPDGDLVTVSDQALTRVHLDTLEPIESFPTPFSSGSTIEVSDDGATMLVVGWDNRAALYGLAGGVKLGDTLDSPSADLGEGVHLSRDGKRLVTNVPQGVLVWDLDPAHQAAAACAIAARDLTAVEWRTYFGSEPQRPTCPTRPVNAGSPAPSEGRAP